MYKFVGLHKLKDDKKKYEIIFLDLETNKYKSVKFGAAGYSDYLIHEDDKKKENYIKRHIKNENWNDPFSRGALSRFILWNKKTLKASLEDYLSRFKSIIKS